MPRCPSCNKELPSNAVLCVACGYHLVEGKHLAAVISPGAEGDPSNPYQPPMAAGSATQPYVRNYDPATRLEFLEERVRELERRVDGTRLLSPSFFSRMFAVLGFWILGYLVVVVVSLVVGLIIAAINGGAF